MLIEEGLTILEKDYMMNYAVIFIAVVGNIVGESEIFVRVMVKQVTAVFSAEMMDDIINDEVRD